MIKISKLLITTAVIVISIALILSGCGKKDSTDDAVAKVNGSTIAKADLDKNFEIYKKSYEAQFGSDIWSKDIGNGKTFEEEIKDKILEKLILEEIILQKAEENGISIAEEKVEEEFNKYKQAFETEEKFKKFLKENNMTEEYLIGEIKKTLIINAFKDNFIKGLNITNEEIENYYKENKELYIRVRARHILVKTEEEAKEILQQLQNGKDFSELAKSKSQDPGSASSGGDLGYFYKGQMVPEFEKAAFSLEAGQISDIVKTDLGFHIIKVEDKIDEFEEVKNDVIKDVNNAKYNEMLQQLREQANVEILNKNN